MSLAEVKTCVCVCVPSLSLSSGILLSVSRTAGITWSYMCSSGLQLSEKLLWCSSSQWSSIRHSLSKDADAPCHHGSEGAGHCCRGGARPEGNNTKTLVILETNCYFKPCVLNLKRDWPLESVGSWEPRRSNHWRWKTITTVWTNWERRRSLVWRGATQSLVSLNKEGQRGFYLSVTLTGAVLAGGPALCSLWHQSVQQTNHLRHKNHNGQNRRTVIS